MSIAPTIARNARFAYPIALLLIFSPLVELLMRLWPVKIYLVQWRFQTELAAVNMAPIFLLGLLLLGVLAWAGDNDRLLRIVALVAALFGLLLLPAVALMFMDGADIQQMAQSETRASIRNNTYATMLKGLLGAAASLAVAIGMWRVAGDLQQTPVRDRTPPAMEDDNDALLVSTSGR